MGFEALVREALVREALVREPVLEALGVRSTLGFEILVFHFSIIHLRTTVIQKV